MLQSEANIFTKWGRYYEVGQLLQSLVVQQSLFVAESILKSRFQKLFEG